MVWGCFSGAKGRGGLFFLPENTTMNGQRYLSVLEEHMLPFFSIHESTHFMHDGAPCHRAKKVTEFLQNKGIQMIEWPGNSPDLNPIENCWNLMKNRLSEIATPSVSTLIEEIQNLWVHGMDSQYYKNLARSMPKRLQLVIKKKGEITK